MKKIIALFVCTILCLIQVTPALAAETEEIPRAPQIVFADDSGFLISMERVPDEEIESNLPEEMAAAVEKASSDNVSVQRGVNPPSSSNIWNLSSKAYPFTANLSRGVIYSNWVFTGHNGKVRFETRDTSGESGYFVITVYIKDGSGYTWHANCAMYRSSLQFFDVEDMNPSDVFYFSITAHLNVRTLLEEGNATLTKIS